MVVLLSGCATSAPGPMIVAHRGFSSIAPDNTLVAYRKAIDAGARLAECDVQLSLDGVPVLMHDDTLKRTTGVDKAVSQLTVAQLQELDAGAWFSSEYAGERIPTLAQALKEIAPRLRFVIEIKGEAMAEAVARVVGESAVNPQDLMIFSFHLAAVDRIARIQPLLPTTWLLESVPSDAAGRKEVVAKALQARVSAVGMSHKSATAEMVRAAHEVGLLVFTWTVNEEADMRRMIQLGVDALISDRPDAALALVGRSPNN